MKTKNKPLATLRMALIAVAATSISSIAHAAPEVQADNGVNLLGSGIILGAPAVEGGLADDLTVAAEYILPASAFTGVKTDGGLINYNDLVPLATNSIEVVRGAGAAVPTGTAVSLDSDGLVKSFDSNGVMRSQMSPSNFITYDESGNPGTTIAGASITTNRLVNTGTSFLASTVIDGVPFANIDGSFFIGSTRISGPALDPANYPLDMSVSFTADSIDTAGSLNGRIITVGNYSLAKTENSSELFKAVEGWALGNGYSDFGPAVAVSGEPIRSATWFGALLFCNALSENEGLTPVYSLGGNVFRDMSGIDLSDAASYPAITASAAANGYRLPTTDEWEYAARSGSNAVSVVGNELYPWGTRVVDTTYANYSATGFAAPVASGSFSPLGDTAEGLQDMGGNVREWTFNTINGQPSVAITAGGSWTSTGPDLRVNSLVALTKGLTRSNTGFRVARNN